MKREAFNFITEFILANKPGAEITRAQVVKHMLMVYNPGPKDKCQHSCRSVGDYVFTYYVNAGILERLGNGKFKILKDVSSVPTYEKAFNLKR